MHFNPYALIYLNPPLPPQTSSKISSVRSLSDYNSVLVPTIKTKSKGRGNGGKYVFIRKDIWFSVCVLHKLFKNQDITVLKFEGKTPVILVFAHAPTANKDLKKRKLFSTHFQKCTTNGKELHQ